MMEPTTTLADALLDDLDDLMESDEEEDDNDGDGDSGGDQDKNGGDPTSATGRDNGEVMSGDDDDDNNNDSKPAAQTNTSKRANPKQNFLESSALQRHLETIREYGKSKPGQNGYHDTNNSKEREEENHQLVVQSNKWLASLVEEIGEAHKFIADAYRPKFSELEQLLPNLIQYKNAVKIIGNEMDLTKVNDRLNAILTNSQIMTISVAGSTTSGRPLSDEEWQNVQEAIGYMEKLMEVQEELQLFVESSMESLVPSVSALIGPSMAARLLGLAGGLQELTKIPSCNLAVVGQTKVNTESRAGLSGVSIKQHSGLLAESDIVRSVPKSFQKKALKVVSAKLALAIRYDFVNVNTGRPRSATTGLKLKAELNEKFEKWQEPDKAPTSKALPK
jgi:U4/U6 small nuclear ribonucleoprotein PRP31